MAALTFADAKQPTIVMRALDDALTSGVAAPVVHFAVDLLAQLSTGGWWNVQCGGAVTVGLTTGQAVAAVTNYARGR